jgi:hypothetical protein
MGSIHARLAIATAVLLLAGCARGEQARRVETDGPRTPEHAAEFALARAASYGLASAATDRVTPDGVALGVDAQYFEPLVVRGWTAPDECAFNTVVDVTVDGVPFSSVPFDGPTRQDDATQSGFVGGIVPVTAPDTGEPARLVLVVAFAHGSVVTLEPAAPSDTPWSTVDTQPADGWSPLGLLVPDGDGSVDVQLTTQDAAGASATTPLTVSDDGGSLSVLTPEWVFDTEGVGPQCTPPADAAPLNPPTEPTPGDQPATPTPGGQPDDPTGATADVLEAIRIVYDIGDLYDQAKVDHMERPAEAAVILDEIREQQVVEPYISNLAPVFDSVVFTDPDSASVRYRVGPSYSWEIGRVLLIDGTWRVALGTFCRDLGDAFYTCPNVEQDPRPGPLGGTEIFYGPNEG